MITHLAHLSTPELPEFDETFYLRSLVSDVEKYEFILTNTTLLKAWNELLGKFLKIKSTLMSQMKVDLHERMWYFKQQTVLEKH